MTTPRIGDTVHYTEGGGQADLDSTILLPTYCCAAIITDVYTSEGNDGVVDLFAFPRLRNDPYPHPKQAVHHDTHDGSIRVTTRPTPGTWHHIH